MATSILGDAGNRSAAPGSKEWAVAVRLDIQSNLHQWNDDVKNVKAFIGLMIRHEGWRKLDGRDGRPFSSFAEFCKAREPYGLGHDPELIDAIQGAKNGTPISRVLAPNSGAPAGNTNAATPWKQKDINLDNVKIESSATATSCTSGPGGNSESYIKARLKRDRPDLRARVDAEEMSARAAGIAAGFVKPPTPLQLLRAAWRKATAEEQQTFINEVTT